MEDPNAITHHIASLNGPEGDGSFHRLLEAGSAALPFLRRALTGPLAPPVKAQLIELIWQTRDPEVVGDLAAALNDPAPEVWKAALDGLVTIGDSSAAAALQSALSAAQRGAHRVPVDWLAEALAQVRTHQ